MGESAKWVGKGGRGDSSGTEEVARAVVTEDTKTETKTETDTKGGETTEGRQRWGREHG